MTWKFFRVDTGVRGRPVTESGSREVITGKGREEKRLENGHVELQAAHPRGFDQHFEVLLEIGRQVQTGTYGWVLHT